MTTQQPTIRQGANAWKMGNRYLSPFSQWVFSFYAPVEFTNTERTMNISFDLQDTNLNQHLQHIVYHPADTLYFRPSLPPFSAL